MYFHQFTWVHLWSGVNGHLQFAETLHSYSRTHLAHFSGIAQQKKGFSDSHIEGGMGSRSYKTPSVPAEHHHTSRPPRNGARGNAMPYDEERGKRPGENEWGNGEDVFRAKSRMMYLAGLRLQEWMRSSWMERACSRCWMSALLILSRCCLFPSFLFFLSCRHIWTPTLAVTPLYLNPHFRSS